MYVKKVTVGFAGQIGVVPRNFIRDLINLFDIVSDNEEFDPAKELKIPDVSQEELERASTLADDSEESPYIEVSF